MPSRKQLDLETLGSLDRLCPKIFPETGSAVDQEWICGTPASQKLAYVNRGHKFPWDPHPNMESTIPESARDLYTELL